MRQIKVTQSITSRDSQSLVDYMNDLKKYPRLSIQEEVDLAQRIHKGDMEARDWLVLCNLRFVISVAKQYPTTESLSLGDLINEGNAGLIRAAESYDETRGFKFISYAVNWINQGILKALAEKGSLVYVPSNRQTEQRRILQFVHDYEQAYQETPSTQEIAEALDMTQEQVARVRSLARGHSSVDAPMGDEDGHTMLDVMQDDDAKATDSEMMKESLRQELDRFLSQLSPRDQKVLRFYYGLGCARKTLDEISDYMGLSHERCRQIREKATLALSRMPRIGALRAFL